jgi:hypothetical protein
MFLGERCLMDIHEISHSNSPAVATVVPRTFGRFGESEREETVGVEVEGSGTLQSRALWLAYHLSGFRADIRSDRDLLLSFPLRRPRHGC